MMTRRLLLFYFLILSVYPLLAQTENSEAIIKFKQRVLSKKTTTPDDTEAKADSLRTLHLIVAGNVYQTEKHINYCYDETTRKYNFRDELKYIQPILSLGDVTIANLKTAFGGDVKNMYSAPDQFALALKYSGINALMHANLHTASISREAFVRTRNLMNEFDLFYTGAFTDNYQRTGNYPLIINKKGFRIAILNYATLNKRPEASRTFYINEIDKDQIGRDMRMAHAYKPDYTIVYFDWGANTQENPSYYQMDIAQYCFQNGADLIVGTHPNAPMRIDYMNYSDNGRMKEGIIAYSLGNLIASNDEIANRNGYLLDIELKKNNYTGDVNMGDWGVIPVYTHYDTATSGKVNIYSVPCSAVESGDILPNIQYIEKRRVVNGAYQIRQLLGSVADEIQYNENEMVANNVMEVIDLTNAAWNNKYSMKRKEEVPESEPPMLPVATVGTNNPPSLASIYEEPVKKPTPRDAGGGAKPVIAANVSTTATDKEITNRRSKIEEERIKAENALAGGPASTIPSNPVSPVDFNAGAKPAGNSGTGIAEPKVPGTVPPSETAVSATGVAKTVGPAPAANTLTAGDNSADNTSAKTNTARTAATGNTTTGNTQMVAPSNVVNDNAATKPATQNTATGNTTTANNKPVVAGDNQAWGKAPVTGGDDERRKRTDYDGSDAAKKAASPRASYREPAGYDVNDPARRGAAARPAAPTPEERPDEVAIKAPANATEGISTGIKSEAIADLTPATGKIPKTVIDTFYRIQFYALKKYLPLDTLYYPHLKGYDVVEENGYFKYLLGRFKSYEDCLRYWKNQIQPRYKESFIVKYINGRRVFD